MKQFEFQWVPIIKRYKSPQKRQAVPAESEGPISVDFQSHSHLGWTHYRILMGIKDSVKRKFYFEQAANERWSTSEFQRKIDGAYIMSIIEGVLVSTVQIRIFGGNKAS